LTQTTTSDVILPAGYTARPVDPDPDARAIYELCAEAAVAEYGTPDVTPRLVRESWNTPGFVPERDTRVVLDIASQPAALVEYYENGPAYVAPFMYVRVRPHLLGAGLVESLVAWAEQRSREAVRLAAPELRVALHASVAAANPETIAILERAGWALERVYWTMEIDLGDAPPEPAGLPDGILIRTAEAGRDEPAVHRLEAESFSGHYEYLPIPYEEWLQARTQLHPYDPSLWFLAVDGDRLVGMSLCLPEASGRPEVGWVATLGVHPEWRGRGLGLALLRHSFGELHRRGRHTVGLGVDSQNTTGATRLYERAGMHVTRESRSFERLLRDGRELRAT
jgi:mycothiol synthase